MSFNKCAAVTEGCRSVQSTLLLGMCVSSHEETLPTPKQTSANIYNYHREQMDYQMLWLNNSITVSYW